jgi:pimeloyl-ACP methyl ester carboxylesterase
MPFIEVKGNNYYYEIVGNGAPLVLIHPYMSSIVHWHKSGWVDLLKGDNKLVMLDYPGHGKSSSPKEIENYYVSNVSEILITLLNEIGISNFSIFGFSMGGRVCFDLIKKYKDKLNCIIVGGMHPKPPKTHKKIITYKEENLTLVVRQKFDANALKLCNQAQDEWEGIDDDEIKKFSKPVLLFAGSEDPYYNWIESTSKLFLNSEFIVIEGLGHIGAFWRTNRIVDHIKLILKGR